MHPVPVTPSAGRPFEAHCLPTASARPASLRWRAARLPAGPDSDILSISPTLVRRLAGSAVEMSSWRAAGTSGWTLLCWSKCWGGFEEWVELAGDVADQAASDFAVGVGFAPSPLGVGAGRWVRPEPGRDDQVQGLVEVAVAGAVAANPDRLAAGGGVGAASASMAEAASLGQRPGWDQAHTTVAAPIGPTPQG
jgi:hypothetical protein